MSYAEAAIAFECRGETLIGIASTPQSPASTGLLIVVGGPQYRVGSHRQFALLARSLAARGVAVFRFDYRGMGDSSGAQRTFEAVADDIEAAVSCFLASEPRVERVVLWALCDGASAASLYAPRDDRVAGLVLLNPWVRTDAGVARAYLKGYYPKRLLQLSFWKKLLTAGVAVGPAVRELGTALNRGLRRRAAAADATKAAGDLPTRMQQALVAAGRPLLFILSGQDYVASEFDDVAQSRPEWSRLVANADVVRLADADHTFSRAEWRAAVEAATAEWLERFRGAEPVDTRLSGNLGSQRTTGAGVSR